MADLFLLISRQRLAVAGILFNGCDRHVSAEDLHQEAKKTNAGVSLATVYNTLNQFKSAGLLREVEAKALRTLEKLRGACGDHRK